MEDPRQALAFSVVAIWEVTIKLTRRRPGFSFDPARLRRLLIASGYREINITGEHALAVRDLPPVHGDAFDRILIAQARVEGARLLTVDAAMARYGAPVEFVR